MISGYVDFEFDLPDALLCQLVDALDKMEGAELVPENIDKIPESQGVYQLFLNSELVYIGKTDAKHGLRKRLTRHCKKLLHRNGIDLRDVSYKAVRIFVFTAVNLEKQLIDHYRKLSDVSWYSSGFGSNNPGRQRETTDYKKDHFDVLYPIDPDRKLEEVFPTGDTAREMLDAVSDVLPYDFRIEKKSSKANSDLETTTVSKEGISNFTATGLIKHVVKQLPTGWQATLLPGYIILYKETRDYPHGRVIARS